jgi:hypothetical protein
MPAPRRPAAGLSAGNSPSGGNGGGILKEKAGCAKRRFKDIVNILPGHNPFEICRRSIMKRKLFLTGLVGVLLLLGTVFLATSCDNGTSGGYTYIFTNNSSFEVTVSVSGIAEFTVSAGATKTVQLPLSDIDDLGLTYTPGYYVNYYISSNKLTGVTTVTFYNKY